MRLKSRRVFVIGLLILLAAVVLILTRKETSNTVKAPANNLNSSLKLVSQVFDNGAQIPVEYTCKGKNINPPLSITGVPTGTKSLSLIMHDPDSVSGDFVHWIVWDIPASTTIIAINSAPSGAIQGINDGSRNKYMGPCPPAGTGTHHYLFELYALDKTLGLAPTINRDQLQNAMAGHILAQHILTGLFTTD